MPRRDNEIVAWHEEPGGSATLKDQSRRVRCESLQLYARIDRERLWPEMGGISYTAHYKWRWSFQKRGQLCLAPLDR
jgi:hypothetical protein